MIQNQFKRYGNKGFPKSEKCKTASKCSKRSVCLVCLKQTCDYHKQYHLCKMTPENTIIVIKRLIDLYGRQKVVKLYSNEFTEKIWIVMCEHDPQLYVYIPKNIYGTSNELWKMTWNNIGYLEAYNHLPKSSKRFHIWKKVCEKEEKEEKDGKYNLYQLNITQLCEKDQHNVNTFRFWLKCRLFRHSTINADIPSEMGEKFCMKVLERNINNLEYIPKQHISKKMVNIIWEFLSRDAGELYPATFSRFIQYIPIKYISYNMTHQMAKWIGTQGMPSEILDKWPRLKPIAKETFLRLEKDKETEWFRRRNNIISGSGGLFQLLGYNTQDMMYVPK